MSKQKTFEYFRQKYSRFIYESFHYDVQSDGLHISFCFRLVPDPEAVDVPEKLMFSPSAFFPSRRFLHPELLSKEVLDALVFNIGMIELVSYWKCFCPRIVEVRPFRLNDDQVTFWKKLYYNGLGEYFYTNGINATMDDFMTVSCDQSSVPFEKICGLFLPEYKGDDHIVPIGGGKDSVVTLEILGGGPDRAGQNANERPLPLIMNPRGATTECVRKAGYTLGDVIVIKRTLDPLMLEFNKQGALNGHTPFSAMLAFYTLLASAMTGSRKRIALSNESSANESTVSGSNVNHQYSKSFEFEEDFRRYVSRYLCEVFDYYSFLRPLTELQIAMLFSQYTHYHGVFKSCNAGSKEDIWCGHCAKCLFAYIILSPFVEPERLNAVFGKNMLDDESLRVEFEQLTGHAETKPFECVGTVSEVNDALAMTIAKWYAGDSAMPSLLATYRPGKISNDMYTIQKEHNLQPDDEAKLVATLHQNTQAERLMPYRELFNFFVGRKALIAGYGREGKSTHGLLKKMFPTQRFDIASNNDEIDTALKNNRYDIIVKSPGIPTFFFEGKCDLETITSQTDLFLRFCKVSVVGVTGTKGKSTTSNLIYHILKSAGRDVVLAGNIGIPLFDILERLEPATIVVAEFSCHQLENIHRSPETAVLLNLYQEHLDHYHGYDDYQNAKMQIALNQHDGDVFIYCADNADVVAKVEEYKDRIASQTIPYTLDEARAASFVANANSPLQGDHNLSNSYAAWLAVRQYGIGEEKFVEALETFDGLEHRLEKVATVDGITYYDDSISTIPQTTIAAIEALKNVDTLILGGFNRGIDYEPLIDYLVNEPLGRKVSNVVLFGSAGEVISRGLKNEKRMLCHFESDYSMAAAVRFAATNTAPGCICLLSPAASSYDHYKNFEYRGNDFKQEVMKLR